MSKLLRDKLHELAVHDTRRHAARGRIDHRKHSVCRKHFWMRSTPMLRSASNDLSVRDLFPFTRSLYQPSRMSHSNRAHSSSIGFSSGEKRTKRFERERRRLLGQCNSEIVGKS